MSVYDHPDYRAQLAGIRAMPEDDVRRLVLADWLEERKEAERAELIRVQCADRRGPFTFSPGHAAFCGVYMYGIGSRGVLLAGSHAGVSYTVDRGFVTAVRGPLAVLVGEECWRCGPAVRGGLGYTSPHCRDCHGTGRTPGILPGLVRREPVGRVEVTDREPWQEVEGGPWAWIRGLGEYDSYDRSELPRSVWIHLPMRASYGPSSYPTAAAAKAALSDAILQWAASPSEVSV